MTEPSDEPNYWIIDTDYENYTIVYSCEPEDITNLWIMAREKTMSRELHVSLLAKIYPLLPNYDWSIAMLEP